MKHQVLVDLAFAHNSRGFAGIPTDARMLFAALSRSQLVEVSSLLWGVRNTWPGNRVPTLEDQAVFLGHYLAGSLVETTHMSRNLAIRLNRKGVKLYDRLRSFLRSRYFLDELSTSGLLDLVWRSYFFPFLPASDRQLVASKKHFLTALSVERTAYSLVNRIPVPTLDTSAHNFILMSDARFLNVSPNTTKIIRYHDGVPIFYADTVRNELSTRIHPRAVKYNEDHAVFVCNSENSLHELGIISETAAKNAAVIPCILPKLSRVEINKQSLLDICKNRVSALTAPSPQQSELVTQWFGNSAQLPKFILSLSTLEPRKNYQQLINAWLHLRWKTKQDLKLMIVGSQGWKFEPIVDAMKPYVASGDLLHLERVSQLELPYLYSAASCFVFASVGEGFGIPPVEAMQCGCPVVMSNIPVHRNTAQDAAVFFDPYDVEEMAEKINSVLNAPEGMRAELINKGYQNARRFSLETILPAWDALFERLGHAKQNGR